MSGNGSMVLLIAGTGWVEGKAGAGPQPGRGQSIMWMLGDFESPRRIVPLCCMGQVRCL